MSYKRLFEYLFLKVSLRFRPWKLQHGSTLDVCNRTLMVSQKVHNSGHSSNDRLSDFCEVITVCGLRSIRDPGTFYPSHLVRWVQTLL